MFNFKGELELSKSWLNRVLILNSFFENILIEGHSNADDCKFLKQSLQDFKNLKTEFYVGKGGTTFRFLALRISRKPGRYKIQLDESLLKRPVQDLIELLAEFRVRSFINSQNEFEMESEGWVNPNRTIKVNASKSSQFLTALLLSSIDLEFDLSIKIENFITSESYFDYTLDLLNQLGIEVHKNKFNEVISVFIKKKQIPTKNKLDSELDISSAFTLSAAAVLNGQVQISNWNSKSSQPDKLFVEIFQRMNIKMIQKNNDLFVNKTSGFKSINVSLDNTPDLFPVLSVLCSFADGISYLTDVDQLVFKESNRLEKTIELLAKCDVQFETIDDGLKIYGQSNRMYKKRDLILFDTAHDHRMAFAAALFILKKYPIKMNDPMVIKKSYPQFYQHIGLDHLYE